jgi:D-alanyl-D-alanine dipeptidase
MRSDVYGNCIIAIFIHLIIKKLNLMHTRLTKYFRWSLAMLSLVFLIGCGTKPPREKGDFRSSDLVEIVKIDSTIILDIRYATTNNFAGQVLYSEPRAFLQRPVANALKNANAEFNKMGFGIVVFDGYRPWHVTKMFWDITPKEKREFVADPRKGSRHNRGCAVDVTLYLRSTGEMVEMPSGYDEMNESAYAEFEGGTVRQRNIRNMLISIMKNHGFDVLENEWWHYDYKDWEKYRIQDISFSEIK